MSDSITKFYEMKDRDQEKTSKTKWQETQDEYALTQYPGDIKVTQTPTQSKGVDAFTKTYPELSKEFLSIQKEQYELFASKMMDYGLGNISLGSDLSEAEDIEFSLTGIWLRCSDKINRLKNILKRKGDTYVENEPMVDSFIDISNYGIIAQLVLRNKWK